MTASLAGIAGDLGDVGWYEEAEDDLVVLALEGVDSMPATAGGGSSKDICRENCEPSLLLISVEEAGVGGCSGRGIMGVFEDLPGERSAGALGSLVTQDGLVRE